MKLNLLLAARRSICREIGSLFSARVVGILFRVFSWLSKRVTAGGPALILWTPRKTRNNTVRGGGVHVSEAKVHTRI